MGDCLDDRFPTLAGSWLVGCSPTGAVDSAYDLTSGTALTLTSPSPSPAVAPAALWAPGFHHGVWRLPDATPQRVDPLVATSPAATAFDGEHIALLWSDGIELFSLGERSRERHPARPVAGSDLALAWPRAAWVEADGIHTVTSAGTMGRLGSTRSSGHRLGGGAGRIAWSEAGRICVADEAGERCDWEADSGFLSSPSVGDADICWEDRAALVSGIGPVVVRCASGRSGPPGGTHPATWGPFLVTRVGAELIVSVHHPHEGGS